jgi:hypothetical protein
MAKSKLESTLGFCFVRLHVSYRVYGWLIGGGKEVLWTYAPNPPSAHVVLSYHRREVRQRQAAARNFMHLALTLRLKGVSW